MCSPRKSNENFSIFTFYESKQMSLTQDLRWSLGRSIALQLQCQTDLLLCTINCFLQWDHLPNMAVGNLAFYYTLYLWGKSCSMYTSRFPWPVTWVSYYAVLLWLLQVVVPLRVLWEYSDATACVVASQPFVTVVSEYPQPFVTVVSEYPHSAHNGTATCSSYSSTA